MSTGTYSRSFRDDVYTRIFLVLKERADKADAYAVQAETRNSLSAKQLREVAREYHIDFMVFAGRAAELPVREPGSEANGSQPFAHPAGGWAFEGEYHTERFETYAEARDAARAYNTACKGRK